MLLDVGLIIGGLLVLTYSADRVVDAAKTMALHFGVSPLVVGLTIVAFGTGAPEFVVSLFAVIQKSGELSVGNVFGSNLFNLLVVIGVSSFFMPFKVSGEAHRKDYSLLVAIGGAVFFLGQDSLLHRYECLALALLFLGYLIWVLQRSRKQAAAADLPDDDEKLSTQVIFLGSASILGLGLGGHIFVKGAVGVATSLGLSDYVVGVTVVALGTSLPELLTSLMAIKKGEEDIALGNIIGSNIFNVLVALAIPGLFHTVGYELSSVVESFDLPAHGGLLLLLYLVAYLKQLWGPVEGIFLLGIYSLYLTHVINRKGHWMDPSLIVYGLIFASLLFFLWAGVTRRRGESQS